MFFSMSGSSNTYNFGVVPFFVDDDVAEGELVRVLNQAGERVDVAKRFGSRGHLPVYVGYGGFTLYTDQEAAAK